MQRITRTKIFLKPLQRKLTARQVIITVWIESANTSRSMELQTEKSREENKRRMQNELQRRTAKSYKRILI